MAKRETVVSHQTISAQVSSPIAGHVARPARERRHDTKYMPRKPLTVAERVEAANGESRSLDF
jgi:hypothetical protein